MDIFTDIGLIILVATIGGFIARYFKQPLIPAYIITGVIIGPIMGLIHDMAVVDVLSEIGIAFLLFIVGIELDLERLKDVGSAASIGALIQMALIFIATFATMTFMGFSTILAIYGGIGLAFSSTMVVIKMLGDKNQLDTLHGRIVIGTLLMQDVVAVFLLSLLLNLNSFSSLSIIISLGYGFLLFGTAIIFSKYIFPPLFGFAAKSQELFFLASISVCFAFSILFAKTGFSIAIGAFVAGITLGNLPYNIEIIGRVKSLRDFFATLFFVSIGIKLTFGTFSQYFDLFMIFLFFTLILSPLITFIMTMLFGYARKVAFLTAISLSQISEFALIVMFQGIKFSHIDEGFLSLIILTTITSMTITAYMFKYQEQLYKFMLPVIKRVDKLIKTRKHYEHRTQIHAHKIILVGYDRIGYNILENLEVKKKDVLIVDYNPDIIRKLIEDKVECIYGDIADDEILEKLNLSHVQKVISTIPNFHDNMMLVNAIKKHSSTAKIIVTSYQVYEALELYKAGVDYVLMPHFLGGKHAGLLLQDVGEDVDKLITTKLQHITELKTHHAMFKHKRHSRNASKVHHKK